MLPASSVELSGMLVIFILSLRALPSVVTALSYLLAWLLITVILGTLGTP